MRATGEEPNALGLSDALGRVTDQLTKLRNIHFALLLISAYCLMVWISIEPRNLVLECQFSALRDEMGLTGRVTWSASGFYNWVFGDQMAEYPISGNYAHEVKGRVLFYPDDNEFQNRPADERFGKTLEFLRSPVLGRVPESAYVSSAALNELNEWMSSAESQGKTYSDFWYAPSPLDRDSNRRAWIRCFQTIQGRCEKVLGEKSVEEAVRELPNSPDNDYFLLQITLQLEEKALSPSAKFMERNVSELLELLKEQGRPGERQWEEIADRIVYIPLSEPIVLPLLGIDVDPSFALPALALLLVIIQVFWIQEVGALAKYAGHVATTWPHRPQFFSTWVGGRPGLWSISLTYLTAVVIPTLSWAVLIWVYVAIQWSSLPTGFSLAELEAGDSSGNLPAFIVTGSTTIFMLWICGATLFDAKSIRGLSFVSQVDEP